MMPPDQGRCGNLALALAHSGNVCQGGPSMKRDGRNARAIDLVSIGDAAAMLGVSKRYVYVLFDRGHLDWYEVGNRKLVHLRDIHAHKAFRDSFDGKRVIFHPRYSPTQGECGENAQRGDAASGHDRLTGT